MASEVAETSKHYFFTFYMFMFLQSIINLKNIRF